MPSIKTLTPILGGSYYHIFNRGINRSPIFFSNNNYIYFLKLVENFLVEYVEILAFCLLPNHFHLVIKVKDEISLKKSLRMSSLSISNNKDDIPKEKITSFKRNKDDISQKKDVILSDEIEIGKLVSQQFRRLFITYSMAINKQENRTGSLFDRSFKRLEITEQEYLEYAIFYAHYNPEKHGIISNFNNYKYSSYKAILAKTETKVSRSFVLDLFGGREEFINYHAVMHEEREAVIME